MTIQYHDFDLLIERTGDGFKARILDSPAGEATVLFNLPFQPEDVENFYAQIGVSRSIESTQMRKMRLFGQDLFEATFAGNVRDKFRESLAEVSNRREGLRIRLRLADVPELANMPWEFMYDTSLSRFLTLSIDTPLVRYLDVPRDIQPLTISPPLQILVVISGPRDFPVLNVQHEWENLHEALNRLETNGLVKLTRLQNPTLQALQHQLRRGKYHIFHFIGHGVYSQNYQDGQLLFENELKAGDPVSGRDLGMLLHDHRHLRLAVLNACEGARTSMEDQFSGTAQSLLQQGIPAVIAMQFRITDIAAITLAREFYSAVADDYPVDAALTEARKAIKTHDNELEWGTPVLYMRSPNGQIFDVDVVQSAAPEQKPEELDDPETEKQLSSLYTEGLESFYLKNWAEAVTKFNAILAVRSSYADVETKLIEAEKYLKLFNLDQQARSAEENKEWGIAVEALETLAEEDPEQLAYSSRLDNARKQLRLENLYTEAHHLSKAKRWLAVIEVFNEIHALDEGFPDPDNLYSSAEEGAALEKLNAELDLLYQRALREIDGNDWSAAQGTLEEIQSKQDGYRQTEQLLIRAKKEIERIEKQEREQEQVASLYMQAENLAARKQWEMVLEKVAEIKEIQPDFDDPGQIAIKAQSKLDKARMESEKQDRLARMYAEAANLIKAGEYQRALDKWEEITAIDHRYPDKQKIQRTARENLAGKGGQGARIGSRRSLWIGIGVMAVIGIGLVGYLLSSNGALNRIFGPRVLFYDDFEGPTLNNVYKQTQNLFFTTTLEYSLEILDGYSVLRLKNQLDDNQKVGLEVDEVFEADSNPFRLELRFNPLVQSETTSIDGFLEVHLVPADNSAYYQLVLFAGNFGRDRQFNGIPVDIKDNTWYRLVVAQSSNQQYRASIFDDSMQNEIVGTNLNIEQDSFQSGIKMRIAQSMGAPGGIYPVDVAIDWIKLSTE